MSRRAMVVVAVVAAGLGGLGAVGVGQPEKKAVAPDAKQPATAPGSVKPAGGQPDQAADPLAATRPGPEHADLATLAGRYTTTNRLFAPGAAPVESTGTAKLSMSLGGRFLVEESAGSMMGQPIESWKMLGFNNQSKQYEGCWLWTMSTGVLSMVGRSADGGKTITLKATYEDAPEVQRTISVTWRRLDADQFVVEVRAEGGETLMETEYKREK